MQRLLTLIVGILLLAIPVLAADTQVQDLRKANNLVAYTPPDKFLAGNFVADEMDPRFIFGTVKDFAASRTCPTAWLIEAGELARVASQNAPDAALEYSLYLEEACPDKVVYYVFVDQSRLNPKQWIDWRQQFHKNKVEGQYAKARTKLENALQAGVGVGGELRFLMRDGELLARAPEEVLRVDLKFTPLYDLKEGKRLAQ